MYWGYTQAVFFPGFFSVGSGDVNSGPYVCLVSVFSAEPSPHSHLHLCGVIAVTLVLAPIEEKCGVGVGHVDVIDLVPLWHSVGEHGKLGKVVRAFGKQWQMSESEASLLCIGSSRTSRPT